MRSESHKRRDYLSLLSRSAFSKILGALRSVVILPLLSPAEFGIFRYILALGAYASTAHLGAPNWLSAREPQLLNNGATQKLQDLRSAAFWISVFGGGVSACALWFFASHQYPKYKLSIFFFAFFSGFSPLMVLRIVQFNVKRDFRTLAKVEILSASLGFVVSLLAVVLFGLEGLIACTASNAIIFLYFSRGTTQNLGHLAFAELRATFKKSLENWVPIAANQFYMNLDMLMLPLFLSQSRLSELGFYGLGIMFLRNVTAVVNAISQVEVVELSFASGATDEASLAVLWKKTESVMVRDAYLATSAALCVYALFVIPLTSIFAAYHPSLPVVLILVVGIGFQRWAKYLKHFATLAHQPARMLLPPLLGASVIAGAFFFLPEGSPIEAYAWVSLGAIIITQFLGLLLRPKIDHGFFAIAKLYLVSLPVPGATLLTFFVRDEAVLLCSVFAAWFLSAVMHRIFFKASVDEADRLVDFIASRVTSKFRRLET